MKQGTRIFIYILIGIAAVIMGSIGIIGSFDEGEISGQDHIDLGRVYLTELSYESAVMEFSEAVEIEPLNPEGYLGLAEAYVGMGDIDKAVEALERGYDKTGDERLRDMLKELLPEPEETVTAVTNVTTAVTTSVTTEETTTVSSVEMAVVPELSGLSEEEAEAACEEAGILYKVSYSYSDDVPEGRVIRQSVPGDSTVPKGITITVNLSKGAEVTTAAVTTAITTPAVETVITTTAAITVQTTAETTVITTTPAPQITTTVSEKAENEKVYDDSGMLLYEKVETDEGYELWWYYPADKKAEPVIHAVEKYDSKGNMTYSTIYEKNGKKTVEGEPVSDDDGYYIRTYNDGYKAYFKYNINNDRYIYKYFWELGDKEKSMFEYDYNSDYEYINKQSYYMDGKKYSEDYYESKRAFEKNCYKKTVCYYSEDHDIVTNETEYKTDSSDKARIERNYDPSTGIIYSAIEYDSNNNVIRTTYYSNGEMDTDFFYDASGSLLKMWDGSKYIDFSKL